MISQNSDKNQNKYDFDLSLKSKKIIYNIIGVSSVDRVPMKDFNANVH